ncbi:carboxyl-terminal protease [Desulforamulus ruminis DSM 2154]|uniref:Carboxyl-terminal protease n=1 Tax=Desulforamulus ruminis (strain ATCC 23193 / DSM 2154 / NCIMB 8452 / DL) TaxID=696281 RepID=F6DP10_DESRL|nr:carboxyl-terminal protease [Desulforamulus ruminis DSM 2154]
MILTFVSLFWSAPAYAEDGGLTEASTLGEVFGYIKNYHLMEHDADALLQASIKGMLDVVDDPYTVYFTPGELEQFSDELNGDFEGIGIELEIKDQLPRVVKVFSGTPAQKAGLQSGDVIVAIEGQEAKGLSIYEVVGALQGKKGTQVHITVEREGQPDFQLALTRDTVDLPTAQGKLLDHNIGYLAIESFGMETGQEIQASLLELKEQGMQSLIIDLRNNGGGYVDAALEAASYLLGKGKTVFITEYREGDQEVFATELDNLIEKLPMVVLINENSASASEILAGALQDYGMATLMGTQTYGKGTVQDVVPLENGGALKLTTAYYLTPKERRIDGQGLHPERVVSSPELQLYAAKQLLAPTSTTEIKFAAGAPRVTINQEEYLLPGAMFEEKGQFYIPLRFTLEALGFEVKWQTESNSIQVSGQGKTWLLPLNNTIASSPLIRGEVTYLPVKELTLWGAQVQVEENTILIKR